MHFARRLTAVGALLLVCLGLAACDRAGGSGTPPVTVREEPATTSTTVLDITVKPAEITIPYAQAVMVELDHLLGEAIRAMVADNGPNKVFIDHLNAVYDEPEFENNQSIYGSVAAKSMEDLRNPPGDPVTKVERILRADPACVVLAVDRTFAAFLVAPHPREERISYIAWSPKTEGSDPGNLNRTPWSIVFDGGTLDGTEPLDAC